MKCWNCDKPHTQWAHKIPQTKKNLKAYGTAVIHHPKNLVPACGLECNSAASISNHTVARKLLLSEIFMDLAVRPGPL